MPRVMETAVKNSIVDHLLVSNPQSIRQRGILPPRSYPNFHFHFFNIPTNLADQSLAFSKRLRLLTMPPPSPNISCQLWHHRPPSILVNVTPNTKSTSGHH